MDRLIAVMGLTPPGPVTAYAIAPLTIGVAARITRKASCFDVAKLAAEAVLSSPSVASSYATYARTGLGLLAVEGCDLAAAEEQYGALKPWPMTLSPINLVCGQRVLGLLARTMGRLDDAMAHFEDALAFCRKAGCRPELACEPLGDIGM